ncbi:hypothetical protein MRX96_001421 [Rhipicephalus microplus]
MPHAYHGDVPTPSDAYIRLKLQGVGALRSTTTSTTETYVCEVLLCSTVIFVGPILIFTLLVSLAIANSVPSSRPALSAVLPTSAAGGLVLSGSYFYVIGLDCTWTLSFRSMSIVVHMPS